MRNVEQKLTVTVTIAVAIAYACLTFATLVAGRAIAIRSVRCWRRHSLANAIVLAFQVVTVLALVSVKSARTQAIHDFGIFDHARGTVIATIRTNRHGNLATFARPCGRAPAKGGICVGVHTTDSMVLAIAGATIVLTMVARVLAGAFAVRFSGGRVRYAGATVAMALAGNG